MKTKNIAEIISNAISEEMERTDGKVLGSDTVYKESNAFVYEFENAEVKGEVIVQCETKTTETLDQRIEPLDELEKVNSGITIIELNDWHLLLKQLINGYHMSVQDKKELVRLNQLVMEQCHKVHNGNMMGTL